MPSQRVYSNTHIEIDVQKGKRVLVRAEAWEQRLMHQSRPDVHSRPVLMRCARVTMARAGSVTLSNWIPAGGWTDHVRYLKGGSGRIEHVERAWMVNAEPRISYIWKNRLYAEATVRALMYHHARTLLERPRG